MAAIKAAISPWLDYEWLFKKLKKEGDKGETIKKINEIIIKWASQTVEMRLQIFNELRNAKNEQREPYLNGIVFVKNDEGLYSFYVIYTPIRDF